MDLNELMKGLFANLKIPKNMENLNTCDNVDKDDNTQNKPSIDDDFLKNFLNNINLEDMFKSMQLNTNGDTMDNTELCQECELNTGIDDVVNDEDTTSIEIVNNENEGSNEPEEKDSIEKKLKNIDLTKMGFGNLDMGNLDFGNLDMGNLDMGNLLSVFDFKNIVKKEENNEEELDEYLN